MTTYGAYDAGLPCKNPSCNSHGKPHPNCRCYGDMAEGGEASRFCSKDRRHDPTCEYFAGGGTVQDPLHKDHSESVAAYLAHQGFHNLIRMKGGDPDEAIDQYNSNVKRGHKRFADGIEGLFSGKRIEDPDHSRSKKILHDWIENGGVTQEIQNEINNKDSSPMQEFAEGGGVHKKHRAIHEHPIANVYPEQNLMLQMAKGRMSDYLNSLRPQENEPRLTFDARPDTTQQKKSYDKALGVAAHPLGVLSKIQRGNIVPEDLDHLRNLHPEVHDALQKKATERIIKDQIENKRPSHRARYGLSLLLGTPLGSEMTAGGIQAAQATFLAKKQAAQNEQPATRSNRSTSSLSKASQHYLTQGEALTSRSQKQ